jgi:hypothetical protein
MVSSLFAKAGQVAMVTRDAMVSKKPEDLLIHSPFDAGTGGIVQGISTGGKALRSGGRRGWQQEGDVG